MHYGAFVPVVREKKSPGNQGEHVKSCMPCVCRYTDLRSVLMRGQACPSLWLNLITKKGGEKRGQMCFGQ